MSSETDTWPILDEPTGVLHRDTLVGGPPHPGWHASPSPSPSPPARGDRRLGAGMLIGIVAALLVGGGIAAAWYLGHRDTSTHVTTIVMRTAAPATRPAAVAMKVAVPRVVGLKETRAIARLESAGLVPRPVYRRTKKAQGLVVSQRPREAASLRKGAKVTLVVASGAPLLAMPDLTGRPYDAAQAKLRALGLTSTPTDVTSTQPAGTIVDQAPKPGAKLPSGANVTLSVARATPKPAAAAAPPTTTAPPAPTHPASVTMPDLQGKTEAEAAQTLWQAGVFPSFVFVPANDPLGTVEQQAKPSGATMPYRTHVQVNLSRGPGDKPQLQVPNVTGKTLRQALATLNGSGLRLLFVTYQVGSKLKAGTIVQQTPLGGATVPRNAQVLVFLASLR